MKQRDRIVYLLLFFSVFWSFLGSYVFKKFGFENIAVLINYAIYGCIYLWFLNKLLAQSSKFNSKKEKQVFFKMGKLLIAYLVMTLLISFIHGERTDFGHFRRNYGVVIPSVFVPFLLAVLSRKLLKGYRSLVLGMYLIMVITIVVSEVMSFSGAGAIDSEEYREGGVFDQANNYGYFLALFQILTIANITGLVTIYKAKSISYVIILTVFVLILKTGSYGSITVTVLGGAYMASNELKKIKLSQAIGAVVLLFILYQGFAFYAASKGASKRVTALSELLIAGEDENIQSQSTFNKRYALVVQGIPVFLENFLIGRGMVGGKDIEYGGESIAVHNVYVAAALKGGVFYLSIVVLMYLFVYKLVRKMRVKRLRKMGFVLLFYLVFMDSTLTAASFLSFNAGSIVLALLFVFVLNDELIRYKQIQHIKAQNKEYNQNNLIIKPA